MDRAIMNSLLRRCGVTDPETLTDARAEKKLTSRLQRIGAPKNLNESEAAIVKELLGRPVEATNTKAPTEAEPITEEAEAEEVAADQAAKGEKAKGEKAKGEKAAKGEPKTEKADKSKTGVRAADVFRQMFEKRQDIPRKEVIATLLEKTGVERHTAYFYIVHAKRSAEQFGFRLKEDKNDKGVKVLHRVAGK